MSSINNILKRLRESREEDIHGIADEIRRKLSKELTDYMISQGFSADEVSDYTRIDFRIDDDQLVIEIGAEISYDGLMDLCDLLNPIVVSYDEDSYFEPITSGIIGAWLEKDKVLSDDIEESSESAKEEDPPVEEAMVYYDKDSSDRDNSDYHDEARKEEESHRYVGKKVRYKEDGRVYTVTRAYDGRDGVVVRCNDITMKPEEYTLKESTEDMSEEEIVWDVINPEVMDAVKRVTGDGFDDASYDYELNSIRGQGIVFFSSEKERRDKWGNLIEEIKKSLAELDYEDIQIYDFEKDFTPPNAPFVAYRIYFRASKSE